ncbi:MAG TPA: DUF4340 domain-containing protein, partial [Planctomycetota bacterium]|nr:DUF4340 domain-containing protein [Planctomycetota bacterium]
VLAVEKPFAGDAYERAKRREHPLFPGFDATRATKLEIRSKEKGVEIERDPDGTWVVPAAFRYRAKMEGDDSVPGFFERILQMKGREPVSDNPASHDRFNVGESGILVRVSDANGAPLVEFRQGRFDIDTKDPDFEQKFSFASFVRRTDSNEVYLVDQFFPMGLSASEWIDTSFVRFEPSSATEFTIEGPLVGSRVHLVKQGETWSIAGPEGGPAKKEVADAWVQGFGLSFFKEVAGKGEDRAKYGLANPELTVRAKTAEGIEHVARFAKGAADKTFYAAKGEDDPWIFVVPDWTVDNLKKKVEDFREPPASQPASAPAEPGAATQPR